MNAETCGESQAAFLARLELVARSQPYIVTAAEALEAMRQEYQVSQGDWANLLGIHPGTYLAVIKGEDRLPMNAVRRAFALGVSADALLQPPRPEARHDQKGKPA